MARRKDEADAEHTEDVDRMRDALWHIYVWTRAYPVEAFPELTKPELAAIREKLGDDVMGRLHASWARHILAGIRRYARASLDWTPQPPAAAG